MPLVGGVEAGGGRESVDGRETVGKLVGDWPEQGSLRPLAPGNRQGG